MAVNNPTDKPVTAKITSPATLPGNLRVDTEITVGPGESRRLMLKKP